MKKILFSILVIFIFQMCFSQAPNKMSYQAVIRNASNNLVINQSVGIRISILQNSSTGSSIYTETHSPTSNANGLVTIEIGNGTIESGDFSAINWGNGSYYIMTETDPTGGTSYSISGTSQLLSVPYALYSKSSGNLDKEVKSGEVIIPTCSGYCYPTILNITFDIPMSNSNYSVSFSKETNLNSSGNPNPYGEISIENKTINGFSIRIPTINYTFQQNKKIYWSAIQYQ